MFWSFEVEGGLVLVRPDLEGLFLLNPTAAEIWCEFSRNASPEAIATSLAEAYPVSYDVALRDVNATLDDWRETLLAERPPNVLGPFITCPRDTGNSVELHFRLHGKHFVILLPAGDLTEEIAPRLDSLRVPPSSPDITLRLIETDHCVQIWHGDQLLASEELATAARAVLLQELVRLSASEGEFLTILHAAACGDESKCVIFPAATHSGKTTLAAILMHSGLALYSDDSVALDRETLNIPAMPFALMLREGSWPAMSARFPGFEDLPVYNRYGQNVRFLPAATHSTNAPACAIVFSRWQEHAITKIEPLQAFDALVRLKESGFWLAHDRASIEQFLNWLQSLPLYEMIYSEVEDAVAFVNRLLRE